METNAFFNMNRVKLLLTRQLIINYKTLLIAAAAIVGILMLVGTKTLVFNEHPIDSHWMQSVFTPVFFIGGLIYTSMIFSELQSPHRGYMYLSLPASTFEKFLTAWLFSSVIYLFFSVFAIYILNFFYILIAALFSEQPVALFNAFDSKFLESLGIYMVFQSIFLLGAVYFRRINFLKTILTLFVVFVFFAVYSGVLSKIILEDVISQTANSNGNLLELKLSLNETFVPVMRGIFWFVVAPFFLFVSYVRLTERQV